MSNTTENKLQLLVILGLIFFIPFYFSWQYNTPKKEIQTQEMSTAQLNKKTKAKIKQISDEEYYHYSQNNNYKQPLLFNESHHALDSLPLINEQTQEEEALKHDELLEQLHIRRKRSITHNHKAANTAAKAQQPRRIFGIIPHKTTLEQLHNLQNIMQEKMKAAMQFYQQTNAQFQRIVQQQYAQHMQRKEKANTGEAVPPVDQA